MDRLPWFDAVPVLGEWAQQGVPWDRGNPRLVDWALRFDVPMPWHVDVDVAAFDPQSVHEGSLAELPSCGADSLDWSPSRCEKAVGYLLAGDGGH